jgi:hypothetical protein
VRHDVLTGATNLAIASEAAKRSNPVFDAAHAITDCRAVPKI